MMKDEETYHKLTLAQKRFGHGNLQSGDVLCQRRWNQLWSRRLRGFLLQNVYIISRIISWWTTNGISCGARGFLFQCFNINSLMMNDKDKKVFHFHFFLISIIHPNEYSQTVLARTWVIFLFFGQDETKIFYGARSIIRRWEWPFGARRFFSEWHSWFLEQAKLLDARRGGVPIWVPIFRNQLWPCLNFACFKFSFDGGGGGKRGDDRGGGSQADPGRRDQVRE